MSNPPGPPNDGIELPAPTSAPLYFQMGKVSDARFNLDWRSPMSPLAAFGTALTVFDSKLGCSPAPPYLRAALRMKGQLGGRKAAARET